MLVKFESQWDKKIKSHKGKTEKHFVFCLVKAKIISLFLRSSYLLLSLVGLLCHVHHPLLHHFVLLLLTLERIRLVGLDRLSQGYYRLLHCLLVVQRLLVHL